MKVTVSKPQKSEVTLTIEVEEAELSKYFDRAAKELSQQVKISGFRPGKVPRSVLEQHTGPGVLRAYALDLGLPYFYADAVIQEKVQVVAKPKIKVVTEEPFVFEAVVAILPEVKINGYDKIKIEPKPIEVTENDVNELINYFQKQNATHTSVDRPAEKGDRVEVDFDGFDPSGDVPLEGIASKNHPLVLGEGTMIQGFEDQLIGMKAGEEKTFELSFPKDYHSKKFQGKKVKFKVKVSKVEEVQLPEVTSEWIKTLTGDGKTPDEFRKQVKENLQKERERQEQTRRENEFFDELLKKVEIELPESLIQEEIDFIMDRTKMDLESKGLSWDQYLKHLESQKRDFKAEKRPQAEKQLKLRLTLQHLYKLEKLEATEQEIEARREALALSYPQDEREKVQKAYANGTQGYVQLQNNILLEKLLKKFLPNAGAEL